MSQYHHQRVRIVHKCLCLSLVLCSLAAWGQTPVFRYQNLGRGKKTIKVQAMAQDNAHNMYFGTDDGLFKYDGIEYQKQKADEKTEIKSVTALIFSGGTLWIGGAQGELNKLENGKTERFTHEQFQLGSKITGFAVYDKALFVTTYGDGVYVIAGNAVQHLTVATGLSDDFVYSITAHAGFFWVGTDAGITRIDPQDNSMTHLSMKDGLPDNIVRVLVSRDDSVLVIGTHDLGVHLLNTQKMSFRPVVRETSVWEHGTVETLAADGMGGLWIGTKDYGLVYINDKTMTGRVRVFSEMNGLGSNRILSLLQDKERNIWIGTHKGISLYRGSTFEYLTKDDGLPGENVYDFLVDRNGNYWVCNDKGVLKFSYSSGGGGVFQTFLENDGSLNKQIVSIFEDASGAIWLGSYGNGLYRLDPGTGKIRNFGRAQGLENTNIMDITQDGSGNLWLATLGGGVARLTMESNREKIEHIRSDEFLKSEYVYCVTLDRDNHLWMGTDGAGVARYDCAAGVFRHVPEGLEEVTIYAIAEDREGNMWFATADRGVFKYGKGILDNFGEAQGLRSTSIVALACMRNGDVVAVHPMGIDVARGDQFIEYNIDKEGFNFEPNLNASFTDRNNLWIGTEGGVVRFSKDTLGLDQQTPKVTLTGLRVLYEPRDFGAAAEFSYGENHFVFDYLGIWMKSPSSIRYQYILEGFDKQWSFETESRNATYSNLPPGEYIFKVVATNGNGYWSDVSQASYSFVILKPFWMKWWFYVLLSLAIGGGVMLFIQARTKRLREDKKRLEDEVSKRTEEIRHQKDVIAEKNKEIVDSINYARRIQSAILPPDRLIRQHLPAFFVLYKPKDIVAGDFYWLDMAGDTVLFAAADCTGHGVPGAMVSVVCNNALNRAVREFGLTEPAKILDVVRKLVVEQFEKSEEDVKDGMDIALCAYNPHTRELQYAGAQNPLWIVSGNKDKGITGKEVLSIRDIQPGEDGGLAGNVQLHGPELYLHEVRPDKQPIGKYAEQKPFTNHRIQLEEGDSIYVFSDGYADQFGGPRGKKFKYKTLKELILTLQDQPMDEQRRILHQRLEEWRGALEQVDDVCVIGVKI